MLTKNDFTTNVNTQVIKTVICMVITEKKDTEIFSRIPDVCKRGFKPLIQTNTYYVIRLL